MSAPTERHRKLADAVADRIYAPDDDPAARIIQAFVRKDCAQALSDMEGETIEAVAAWLDDEVGKVPPEPVTGYGQGVRTTMARTAEALRSGEWRGTPEIAVTGKPLPAYEPKRNI